MSVAEYGKLPKHDSMPIKTGVAAYGLSGSVFHVPFLMAHEGFTLEAVVERHTKRVQRDYPAVRSVNSFDELLQSDVELIVINTPDATHYDLCRRALESGRHVVVEKPFVETLREAEKLVELAVRQGLLLTVYQNRRWDNDFLTVREVIERGEVGRVVEFCSSFQRFRPTLSPIEWKESGRGRVGITYNLVSHLCDQAVVLFGRPEGVWATLGALRDGSRIDDYSLVELLYPRLRVTLRASMLVREEAPRFAVHGTGGSYVKFGTDPQEQLLRYEHASVHSAVWCTEPESAWGVLHNDAGRRPYPTVGGNYMRFYDNVYAVLCEGAQPAIATDQMLCDMQILDAAFESHRTGRVIGL